ncbi:MAG TPA: thiamine-phosphate kinase [Candidatus Acidoferrales bacterium]|jgi:thiamine-monophosphate kinase|nr:thiamine-phosphate kinase [Candidatus Acidoferrales bacterium]
MGREDQLIKELALGVPSASGRRKIPSRQLRAAVRLGIGDDAAVIVPGRAADMIVTCDAFMEGVHFLADRHPADSVGYKALARATSDVTAMGATPQFFLLTLAIPQHHAGQWLSGFLRGMRRAARELGLVLIGGDTTRSRFVAISITVLGEVAAGRAIGRAGARPGDIVYVTGRLGCAKFGLEIVRNCTAKELKRAIRDQNWLLGQHLYPRIRVQLGEWLAKNRIASSMIDVSDGLSTDLGRLCASTGVGARISADRIPSVEIPASHAKFARKHALDPLQMALHGGDDYELLFTVPSRLAERLRSAPEFADITPIGEIERGRHIHLVDARGGAKLLKPGGWDPFRKR